MHQAQWLHSGNVVYKHNSGQDRTNKAVQLSIRQQDVALRQIIKLVLGPYDVKSVVKLHLVNEQRLAVNHTCFFAIKYRNEALVLVVVTLTGLVEVLKKKLFSLSIF